MGKMQRRKGKIGELGVVHIIKAYGVDAKRVSMLETNGQDKGDVEMWKGSRKKRISVKFGQHVPKFHYTALGDQDYLISRRNSSPWLVTMRFKDFMELWDTDNEEVSIV